MINNIRSVSAPAISIIGDFISVRYGRKSVFFNAAGAFRTKEDNVGFRVGI
jgi:hypothetical protein